MEFLLRGPVVTNLTEIVVSDKLRWSGTFPYGAGADGMVVDVIKPSPRGSQGPDVLAGVVIGDADAIQIRLVNGVAVFASESVEGIVSAKLVGGGSATHTCVWEAIQGEGDGLATALDSLGTHPLLLLEDVPEALRAFLLRLPHVEVDRLQPALARAKWRALHVHVAVQLVWGRVLPLANEVVAGWSARLDCAEVVAGRSWVLQQQAQVDELLKAETNLEERLSEGVQILPDVPCNLFQSIHGAALVISSRSLTTNPFLYRTRLRRSDAETEQERQQKQASCKYLTSHTPDFSYSVVADQMIPPEKREHFYKKRARQIRKLNVVRAGQETVCQHVKRTPPLKEN